jgi:hypothetical protein
MLDLSDTSATVSPWNYPHSSRGCHAQTRPMYQMYVRDVDFAPDSSYFAVASTGGHRINGEGPGLVLCDSVARFNTANLTPSQPAWINYTGGDTLTATTVTTAAVYVQGHNRWLNNGTVDRPGIGAISPTTGLALDWNPTKTKGSGGQDLLITSAGLWVPSDTNYIGGKLHEKLGFLPLP